MGARIFVTVTAAALVVVLAGCDRSNLYTVPSTGPSTSSLVTPTPTATPVPSLDPAPAAPQPERTTVTRTTTTTVTTTTTQRVHRD